MPAEKFTASADAVVATGGTTPTAVALPAFGSPTRSVRVCNTGSNHAHVAFGGSGVVATATSPYVLPPNSCDIFSIHQVTHVSAFAATGSPAVHVTIGVGE
jgi:hypothetical protein